MLRPMSVKRNKEKGEEDNNGAIDFHSIELKISFLDYQGYKERICR